MIGLPIWRKINDKFIGIANFCFNGTAEGGKSDLCEKRKNIIAPGRSKKATIEIEANLVDDSSTLSYPGNPFSFPNVLALF